MIHRETRTDGPADGGHPSRRDFIGFVPTILVACSQTRLCFNASATATFRRRACLSGKSPRSSGLA